uniref:Glycosyl transferase family 25 domain-containing protein n=1 Tax=viral metagenome TaxID=1070528 RepID=A0A6C0KBD9_9ZZZZ
MKKNQKEMMAGALLGVLVGVLTVCMFGAELLGFDTFENFENVSSLPTRAFVINLDKRKDRFAAFVRNLRNSGFNITIQRSPAVVGKDLDLSTIPLAEKAQRELSHVMDSGYRTMHYQLTPGAIGCYLSHVKLWKYILDNNLDNVLIFEDDAKVPPNFEVKLKTALHNVNAVDPDWDIFILDVLCRDCVPVTEDIIKVNKFYLLHAYVMRRKGVEKIFKSNILFPIEQQVDWMLSQHTDKLKIYSLQEGIVKQSGSATDIQAPLKEIKEVNPFKEVDEI